jgi:hypothetical protein
MGFIMLTPSIVMAMCKTGFTAHAVWAGCPGWCTLKIPSHAVRDTLATWHPGRWAACACKTNLLGWDTFFVGLSVSTEGASGNILVETFVWKLTGRRIGISKAFLPGIWHSICGARPAEPFSAWKAGGGTAFIAVLP